MSYVRSRVEEFEKTANNKEQQQSDSTAAAGSPAALYTSCQLYLVTSLLLYLIFSDRSISLIAVGRKKFLYPGRRQRQSNSVTRGGDKAPVANSRIPATAAGGARNSFETGAAEPIVTHGTSIH